MQSFVYEQKYPGLRHDGFAAIKNTVTGKFKFYFVENDCATNPFDKVKKYSDLHEKEGYQDRWWCKLADRFPPVLVVTSSAGRAENIQKLIDRDNAAGIEFQVHLLSDIKKEVFAHVVTNSSAISVAP